MQKKSKVTSLENRIEEICHKLATTISQDQEQEYQKTYSQGFQFFKDYSQHISQGWHILIPEVEALYPETIKTLAKHLDYIEDYYPQIFDADYLMHRLEAQQTLQDILTIPVWITNNLYKAAIEIYNRHNYTHAAQAFRTLLLLNHLNTSYWTSYGLAHQLNHQPEEALLSYTMASNLEEPSFTILCYSVECWIALENWEQAYQVANNALEKFDSHTDPQQWKDYCQKLKSYAQQRR
ncbi:MAG: hypothetical protein ACQEP8_04315 [Chlamydiota bacterium]